MGFTETIRLKLEMVSEGFTNPLGRANKKMNEFQNKTKEFSESAGQAQNKLGMMGESTKRTTKTMDGKTGFLQVMRANAGAFKAMGKNTKETRTRMGQFAFATRNAFHGLRGFKMEMLGVMFFGMGMARLFKGLTNQSMEWLGVWDLLSIALGILFLPLAKDVLNWTIKFLKWVSKLTDEEKKFWSRMVLIGVVLGTVIMLFGMLALGIGSMMLAFGFLFSPLGLVISALVALGGFLWLGGMFDNIGDAAGTAEEKLMAFGLSGESLTIIKEKMGEVLEKMKSMVPEFATTGGSIAKSMLDGLINFFKDNPLIVIGALVGLWFGGPALASLGAALGALFHKLDVKEIKSITEAGTKILDGILDGVANNSKKIGDAIGAVVEVLLLWAVTNADKIQEIGSMLALNISIGIGNALKKILPKLIMAAIKSAIKRAMGGGGFSVLGVIRGASGALLDRFNQIDEGKGVPEFNDFVWRPGQGAIGINPNDTLVGFKGAPPNLGGGEGVIITNNFYGFTSEELKRELDNRDSNMVSQIEANR